MSLPDREVYQFPCSIPLKVIGRDENDFAAFVLETMRLHIPNLGPEAITPRPSRDGNYTSLTILFQAESREQLDRIYAELSRHERVLMVL